MQGKLINARQGKDARQGAQGKGRKAKQRTLGKVREGKGRQRAKALQCKRRKTNGARQIKRHKARQRVQGSHQYKAMHMEQSKGKCARQGKQNAQEKPKAY